MRILQIFDKRLKQQLIKTNKQTTTTTRTTETGDTVGEARDDDCSNTSKNKCEMESYLNLFKLKEILRRISQRFLIKLFFRVSYLIIF